MVERLLEEIDHNNPYVELWAHHGDCIGADEQFHNLAITHSFAIHLHPPEIRLKRAWCRLAELHDSESPKPYRERNQDIVNAVDLLIATPAQPEADPRSKRSGTWMTIRLARRANKPHVIIYSNGDIEGRDWWKLLK
jgi:hypothetical protein